MKIIRKLQHIALTLVNLLSLLISLIFVKENKLREDANMLPKFTLIQANIPHMFSTV